MTYRFARTWLVLLLACARLNTLAATNTANLHLFDRHVWLDRGEARVLGQVISEIVFSSLFDFEPANGEFVYSEDAPPGASHATYFLLTDVTLPGFPGIPGELAMELPVDLDDDADGIPDFHQVTNAVSGSRSDGFFVIYDPSDPNQLLDSGSVSVQWNRNGGESRGTCVVTLLGEQFITAPLPFTHPFEIAEYAGTYTYIPSSSPVLGNIDAVQIGHPDRRIDGPLALELWPGGFSIDGAEILASIWPNAMGREYTVDAGYLERAAEFPVEYFGELLWSDNDLATAELFGYGTYFIGIDDPNDHDSDGIPDLTDPPGNAVLPRLALRRAGDDFVLEIEGELNQTFQLQTAPALTTDPGWTQVDSITLTNSPQTISLPSPTASARFWRLAAVP
jgi:hypothetical protein